MSKIVPPDRCSTGFQTHLERRFTPDRFGGSAIRQVWKSALSKTRLRRVARLRDSQFAPCQREKRGALRRGYF
jgi:hypothetical protein